MAGRGVVAAKERELLVGFRLRTAAAARNAAWITLAGIAALTAPHHSPGELGTHTVVWVLLAAAALGNLLTYTQLFNRLLQATQRPWPFHAWTLLLLLFDAGVVFVSHDAQHQVYLIYIPVLLFAAVTMEARAAAGAVLLAVASALGAIALRGDLSTDVAIASTSSFVVVALLGVYFSREERHEIAEAARQNAEAVRRGQELAALHERAVELNSELQATVTKVIQAQEAERRRIGRELHDEAVQLLSAAAVRLGDLEQRVPSQHRGLRRGLGEVREILTNTLWEIRKIIVDLRPSDLDDLGLIPALAAYARNRLGEAGVAVETHLERPARALPADVETALFRIAQEAVNNVARHADARHAAVSLRQQNGHLELRVDDDGVGFEPGSVQGNGNGEGLGLLGMKERTALLGGEFELISRPGDGTSVVARIPAAGGGDGR